MQRPHARDLPYYLSDEELDFFVKGVAWGPHKDALAGHVQRLLACKVHVLLLLPSLHFGLW